MVIIVYAMRTLLKAQIIDKIEGSVHTNRVTMDHAINQVRKNRNKLDQDF